MGIEGKVGLLHDPLLTEIGATVWILGVSRILLEVAVEVVAELHAIPRVLGTLPAGEVGSYSDTSCGDNGCGGGMRKGSHSAS